MKILIVSFSLQALGRPGDGDSGDNEKEIFAVATISDINRLVSTITLYALLEIDVNTQVVLEDKHLLGFANYLDYQWVGIGKTAYLYPAKIASFIATKINEGTPPEQISQLVIASFQQGDFSVALGEQAEDAEDLNLRIGAYLVGEIEFHQEPNGEFLPLVEINQAKLYFSGQYDPKGTGVNSLSMLAEFNPVPEEVIHHIEAITLEHNGHTDTLSYPEPSGEGLIPFERLQFSLQDIGKSGIHLTFGQIRNPFGLWSDYSSHRNFTSTKNNLLVNGFALKKIELGMQLDRQFGPLTVTAALVHGRQGRTTPVYRADNDDRFDAVARVSYARRGLRIGASAYVAELGVARSAFGIDASLQKGKFLLGGELVYQRNAKFGTVIGLDDIGEAASSMGGYFQVDFAVTPKLHAYGLYDVWAFQLDGNIVNHPVASVFHGMRYYILKNLRWTMFEFGYMDHREFDEGMLHMSTQLEVSF